MHLLLTGATGFVMSVLGRYWLDNYPSARLTILDITPLDATAQRYFSSVADRLQVVVGDVTRPEQWRAELDALDITHIVHGATITPISRGSSAEASREPEAQAPARILDVNIMGSVALLEFARALTRLQRFIYVSSGSVYKEHGPDRPGEPLPEDGYVLPRKLYGISKFASELISERYGELFGFSCVTVRLSSVYGTMDRVTASRNFRHVPNRLAHLAVDGAIRVRVNTLDAVGDYVHAEDVAAALVALLAAERLSYSVYNIAAGRTTTLGELIAWTADKAPGFEAELCAWADADIQQDPTLKDGMWGAYDIARIRTDTGWQPRPVRDAYHGYIDWIKAQRRLPQ